VPGVRLAASAVTEIEMLAGAVPEVGLTASQLPPDSVDTVVENGSVAPVVEPDAPRLTDTAAGVAALTTWENVNEVGFAVKVMPDV
jgi:hypothetical protein